MPTNGISSMVRWAILAACAPLLAACGPPLGQEPSEVPFLEVQFSSDVVPPTLSELEELSVTRGDPALDEVPPLVREAIRETALALGAQGGLAWRSNQINLMLERLDTELTGNFPFAPLVIRAPNGGVVLPPVVSEDQNAYTIATDGQSASRADRVYRIATPGKLVGTTPTWRDYLVRTFDFPDAPLPQLLPKNVGERILWRQAIREGWESGIAQANEIFDYDVRRLERDIQGMARYRHLVSLGLISEIYFSSLDKGVTGGGDTLRVGERVVRIASPAQLNPRSQGWTPILINVPDLDSPLGLGPAPQPADTTTAPLELTAPLDIDALLAPPATP